MWQYCNAAVRDPMYGALDMYAAVLTIVVEASRECERYGGSRGEIRFRREVINLLERILEGVTSYPGGLQANEVTEESDNRPKRRKV